MGPRSPEQSGLRAGERARLAFPHYRANGGLAGLKPSRSQKPAKPGSRGLGQVRGRTPVSGATVLSRREP
jgi:hypothetical protein